MGQWGQCFKVGGYKQDKILKHLDLIIQKMCIRDRRVALESGKIDGYVSERPEGVSATSANKNFAMVEFEDGQGFKTSDEDTAIAVGLKKDSDLKDKINKILAGISEDERKDLMDQAIKDQPASEDLSLIHI